MSYRRRQDTFTKVPNHVLEALARIGIPGEARRVFDVIVRKTWGWRKDKDPIALSQFEEATGLDRANIRRAIKRLKEMSLIHVDAGGVGKNRWDSNIYEINQEIFSWNPSPQKPVRGVKADFLEGSGSTPTKETITKENIERMTASPSMIGKEENGLVWVVNGLQKLASEFIHFRESVNKRYSGNYYKLAAHLVKIGGCPSYVVFTCGRLYLKFKGTDTLTDPLAYLHTMLKPDKATYQFGDGLTWNEKATAEEYYQTFFSDPTTVSNP